METLCRISNAVFEYQPITSEIVTQLSRYKRPDTNLVADGKGFQHWGQIHLYLYIYSLPESGNSNNERRGTENMFSRHKTQSHGWETGSNNPKNTISIYKCLTHLDYSYKELLLLHKKISPKLLLIFSSLIVVVSKSICQFKICFLKDKTINFLFRV